MDTSCLIATLCGWHDQNLDATAFLNQAVDRGDELLVAAHTLVEAYSVLTRLPAPHRMSPAAAVDLLGQNVPAFRLVALQAEDYWPVLSDCAARGIAGGTVYDGLIAANATVGGADVLLTLNERHMRRVAGDSLEVVAPSGTTD